MAFFSRAAFLFSLLFLTCTFYPSPKDITLFYNAHIAFGDSLADFVESMAISKGRIVGLGNADSLRRVFSITFEVDVQGHYIYPAFNDAHAHFYNLGMSFYAVDLRGTNSWEEAVKVCEKFAQEKEPSYLTGRGWDQTKWENNIFPDNELLNRIFPDIPVLLTRVDGHAAICNDVLLSLAKCDTSTQIEGGELLKKDGKLTGVLIDNALAYVRSYMPQVDRGMQITALKDAEKRCFSYGLTSLTDAGLSRDIIHLVDSLQKEKMLYIRINAMVEATDENIDYYVMQPIIETGHLRVGSFKLYADGALGSRGAFLLEDYADRAGHRGLLLSSEDRLEDVVKRIANSSYQLNTHCIGDAANRIVLSLYAHYLNKANDRRWRIEHAQVIRSEDMEMIKEYHIIPSIQPTHATSDMFWAEERLGSDRIHSAYAYRSLLEKAKIVAMGTDAPIESINPFHTFFAAVARTDVKGKPQGGFLPSEKLTRKQALLGMTIWPAYAAFEENIKGSLDIGKWADFVVLPCDLLQSSLLDIRNTKVIATYLAGEKVYSTKHYKLD